VTDWFKIIGDVVDAVTAGDDAGGGGLGAYLRGESTQSVSTDGNDAPPTYVYERVLTRPRDPSINDR
jgi:hypothetical protein